MASDDWNENQARALVGARVLVGLTRAEPAGDRMEQIHGVVASAERGVGVEIMLEGSHAGEMFMLPPDLDVFRPAAPGHYRLRETGEVVVDPDYVALWTIKPPPN